MKHAWLSAYLALTLSLCLSGCSRGPSASGTEVRLTHRVEANSDHRPAPRESDEPVSRHIVAVLDATGSFGCLRDSLRRLARFVGEELAMGDVFSAFFIKNKLDDSPQFLVQPTVLPARTRRIGDPGETSALRLQSAIQARLLTYAKAEGFRKVVETDLVQSLAYAGRLLDADPASRTDRWLLAFTDLEDTVGSETTPGLQGVNVRVFYVPTRGDLAALSESIASWTAKFRTWGAASVAIYDTGQTFSLQRLLTAPFEAEGPEIADRLTN